MNPAEEMVYRLCRKSFLSLWSYMNPRQKINGKELCDVLVVCDPHVIIFSVKHIGLRQSGDPAINAERWKRRAVHESVAQLHGADRKIKTTKCVVRNDNTLGVPLPLLTEMRVHRVAIALGGEGLVGMGYGHFEKGFVHVFDEQSADAVLTELNTITDFAKYLSEKEQYLTSGAHLVCNGAEEDLLALYLQLGRKFPEQDVVVLNGDLWKAFRSKPEYQNKVNADTDSYAWDKIVETFCHDMLHDNLEFAPGPTATERAIRVMAKEDRFARRVIGKSFTEFLDESHKIRARHVRSPSGVEYVFLATPPGFPRNARQAELANRCFVVRGLNPQATTLVGIATEQYTCGKEGFSFDLVYTFRPSWTPEDQTMMENMQRDLGYFVKPRLSQSSEDEYPASEAESTSVS